MTELESKIKTHESRLADLETNFSAAVKNLAEINKTTNGMQLLLKDILFQNSKIIKFSLNSVSLKDFLPSYLPWIATMLVLILGAHFLSATPDWFKAALDFVSSWVATIVILVSGIVCAAALRPINKLYSVLMSIGFASIFTSYLAYITVNFGSFEPHVAAFGFNLGETLRDIIIVIVIVGLTIMCRRLHDERE